MSTLATPSVDTAFEALLPRLVTAYATGKLVPFIGAGMSAGACATWPRMISALEQHAGLAALEPIGDTTPPDELIRRANRATATLRSRDPAEFASALARSLFAPDASPPPQTVALAALWWPLVMSTNYDNYLVRAVRAKPRAEIAVVGRGPADCQRVLSSLTSSDATLLWALQGHLGEPCDVPDVLRPAELRREIVIDHSEYRRVTYREPHFRRAFAEVFRHRSLFFLGSGLRENYIQELLGEALELYGPTSRPHFAILPRGEVDPGFLLARFQIVVVEYDREPPEQRGSTVIRWLRRLGDAVAAQRVLANTWSFGEPCTTDERCARLEIVRGPLPQHAEAGDCIVISAGGALRDERFFVSESLRPTLAAWCGGAPPRPTAHAGGLVARYGTAPAFAARARRPDEDRKDLTCIRAAMLALFDLASREFHTLRAQLIAVGRDEDAPRSPAHSERPYPARFSFIQVVRAWGEWLRANPESRTRLVLHVMDETVLRELSSGRLDVVELLHCSDLRFWTEIEDAGSLQRRSFHCDPQTTLERIAGELCLHAESWTFELVPHTSVEPDATRARSVAQCAARTLDALGVVPGSTLHFKRA